MFDFNTSNNELNMQAFRFVCEVSFDLGMSRDRLLYCALICHALLCTGCFNRSKPRQRQTGLFHGVGLDRLVGCKPCKMDFSRVHVC